MIVQCGTGSTSDQKAMLCLDLNIGNISFAVLWPMQHQSMGLLKKANMDFQGLHHALHCIDVLSVCAICSNVLCKESRVCLCRVCKTRLMAWPPVSIRP